MGPSFLGVVVIFCAFAFVAWVLFRFAAPAPTYEDQRAQARRDKVAIINKEAQEKLYGPAKWVDKAKGTVQLPIDVAMQLVINDYKARPVAPSAVKVDDPYPYGLVLAAAPPAAAATGTNAAPAAKPATTGTAAATGGKR